MLLFRSFLRHSALRSLFVVALPAVALSGCDILNKAASDVTNAVTNIPIDVTQSTKISLDVGTLIGAAAGQKAPADTTQAITTPPQPVDLNKEQPDLAKYANGHIKTLEIAKIAVTPTTNTLTGNLPALDLYVGPTDLKNATDGIKVATIPAIPAGSTALVNATIDAAAMTQAGTQYLAKLAFAQALKGTLVVKAGDTLPGGKIDLKLDLGVHAIVTPL